MVTLPFEARNQVLFIIVGFANRPASNISGSQPLIFYQQKLCKINFANLKKLLSMICGFRIPDSGFRLRIPVSGFRLLGLPENLKINFLSQLSLLLNKSESFLHRLL